MEFQKPTIALISSNASSAAIEEIINGLQESYTIEVFTNGVVFYNALAEKRLDFKLILSISAIRDVHGISLKKTIDGLGFGTLPFFLIVDKIDSEIVREGIKNGFADVFEFPINDKLLKYRLDFQLKHPFQKFSNQKRSGSKLVPYQIPFLKRTIDVLGSGIMLLLLSPLFLLVSVLIKLESKGPVFYYSYRVGTGYSIFKFYKFRSMQIGADANLQQLKHLNQYVSEVEAEVPKDAEVEELCEFCEQAGGGCLQPLYDDNQVVCERLHQVKRHTNKEAAFIKIKDDPRVTKIGKFIRNTSIDELPQLWNVLKGDMSLVGNRPLPLYEAEKITTDKYALRFLGPAGITGLWQVEKRGRGEMSEDERLSLDNDYVKNFSVWFDFKIILRTIPALFQSENV